MDRDTKFSLCHSQDELNDLLDDGRASRGFPVLAAVPVSGDELAMPAEDGIWSDDGGKLVEHLAAEDLAFYGEPTALAIVEEYSFLSELLPEYVILSQEILDGVLLVAIDPAGEDQEQQVPWLKLRFHVPPDARSRSGASGIVGYVSSVRGKTHRYSLLRLG